MSAQDAKRRRAASTAAALSKPFRSPFRATPGKPNRDSQDQPSDLGRTQLDETAYPQKVSRVPRARDPPTFPYKRQQGVNLSSRSPDTSDIQLEIAALVKAQRQLKNKLHSLTEELHLCEQAHKIERHPSEASSDGGEVDGELLRLTERWKAASRQAAEELFGSAKDKINRYVMESKSQAHNSGYEWSG
jgi:Swi5-dependent recombination DNA repair protein 1